MIDTSPSHLFDSLAQNINDLLPKLPTAAATLLVGLVVIRILSWIASWLLSFIRMPKGLRGIIVSLIDILLSVFLTIVTLQALGLSNVAFAFSAAVAAIGLALGNGSVTIVQDILAGIFLAKDHDFSVGDVVRVAEEPGQPGVEGVVEAMDMRRTRVRDEKGYLHIFPNSYIERREWVLLAKKKDR
ncbi:MAG TPA: mechanosensitive ion channel family protein [Candidatus Saccharimonadales bacterium]|nr:mechanosensitive ion channel family protein [Candidatus Saccharimonadales bacterium]